MKKGLFITLVMLLIFGASGCGKPKADEALPKYEVGVITTSRDSKSSTIYFLDNNLENMGEKKLPYSGMTDVFDVAYVHKGKLYCAPRGIFGKGTKIAITMDIKTGKVEEFDFSKHIEGSFLCQAANDYAYYTCGNLNGIYKIIRYDMESKELIEIVSSDEYLYIDADDKYVYAFANSAEGRDSNLLLDKYVIFNQKDLSPVKEIQLNNYGYGSHSLHGWDKYYFTYNEEANLKSYIGVLDKATLEVDWIDLGETKSAMIEKMEQYIWVANSDSVEAKGTGLTLVNPVTKETTYYGLNHNVSDLRVKGKDVYVADYNYKEREVIIYKYVFDMNTGELKEVGDKKIELKPEHQYGSIYLSD